MARLVLVDDDDMLRQVLADNLQDIGHQVQAFADPESAFVTLVGQTDPLDLLILDWALPGSSGLDLLKQLRNADITTPALFFTSHNDTLYEEAALACGAVDFVDKTRSFTILSKRIALILERETTPAVVTEHNASTPAAPDYDDLSINSALHEIRWKGAIVTLTYGEFRMVDFLAAAGRDVSYREIYDVLKGEDFIAGDGAEGYRANVRAMIKRIRQKFCDVDPTFDHIRNYPGFGYRWGRDHA